MNGRKIVIVTGATGDIGRAFLDHYSQQPGTTCYGFSRSTEKSKVPGVTYLKADLTNPERTKQQLARISLKGVSQAVLIHSVGKFKFEEEGSIPGNGIDPEIQESNVETFNNVAFPLIEKRRKAGKDFPIKLVAFGSLSDYYEVPWWGSYSRAKKKLKSTIRALMLFAPNVQGIFAHLSSTQTTGERQLRPSADTTHWLKPQEIVNRLKDKIDSPSEHGLEEHLFNPSPEYHEGYYTDFEALKHKWKKEMRPK